MAGIISTPQLPPTDSMNDMSLMELQRLRRNNQDDPSQATIAPYEHQAFARAWTRDQPVLAPIALTTVQPFYTAAKAIGLTDGMRKLGWLDDDGEKESPPSFAEIGRGYKGIAQGWGDVISNDYNQVKKDAIDTGNAVGNAAKTASDYLADAWNNATK